MKILIIVPAYNEEESLAGVIRDLRDNVPAADVIVVNDGSHDATSRVGRDLGVTVLDLPFNLGIGAAVQAGYLYADRNGYDIAVQFDGDGQHLAREIGRLLEPLEQDRSDIVIGSRFLAPGAVPCTGLPKDRDIHFFLRSIEDPRQGGDGQHLGVSGCKPQGDRILQPPLS